MLYFTLVVEAVSGVCLKRYVHARARARAAPRDAARASHSERRRMHGRGLGGED